MLAKWSEGLTKKTYFEWNKKYNDWDAGFKLFFGPVKKNPKLAIITLNPGKGKEYFQDDLKRFKSGDFATPKIVSYTRKATTFSKKINKFFGTNSQIIGESLVFPILFFRSQTIKQWKKRDQNRIKEAENFCYEIVKEIITKTKPKKFLVVGISTKRRLKKKIMLDMKDVRTEYSRYKTKKEKLYVISNWNGSSIFTIRHLSGSHFLTDDLSKSQKALSKFLTNQSIL